MGTQFLSCLQGEVGMNEEMLARARERVPDVRLFINGVSKRASQLAKGAPRLIAMLPNDERTYLDIALQEVAEGKVIIGYGDDIRPQD